MVVVVVVVVVVVEEEEEDGGVLQFELLGITAMMFCYGSGLCTSNFSWGTY